MSPPPAITSRLATLRLGEPESKRSGWSSLSISVVLHAALVLGLIVIVQLPASSVVYDLIYAPLETTLLRQARLSGHRTANGKGMNIAQAVDALYGRVCRGWLESQGLAGDETHRRIVQTMCEVW